MFRKILNLKPIESIYINDIKMLNQSYVNIDASKRSTSTGSVTAEVASPEHVVNIS